MYDQFPGTEPYSFAIIVFVDISTGKSLMMDLSKCIEIFCTLVRPN